MRYLTEDDVRALQSVEYACMSMARRYVRGMTAIDLFDDTIGWIILSECESRDYIIRLFINMVIAFPPSACYIMMLILDTHDAVVGDCVIALEQ